VIQLLKYGVLLHRILKSFHPGQTDAFTARFKIIPITLSGNKSAGASKKIINTIIVLAIFAAEWTRPPRPTRAYFYHRVEFA
jgi:hypothetical protein